MSRSGILPAFASGATHTCCLKVSVSTNRVIGLAEPCSVPAYCRAIASDACRVRRPTSSSPREAHDTYGFSCVARSHSRHPGLGRQRAGRPAHPPLRRRLRPARLQRRRAAHQAAARRLQGAPSHHQPRRDPGRVGGRCRRGGRQGLGARAWRHPLHALVPAAHRHHRREARRLPLAHARRQGRHRVQRQGTDQGRARRLVVPVRAACAPPSRRAATRRGTRPARRGSTRPRRARRWCIPSGVHQLDRRVARQEDAAAPLDRGVVQAGRPHPEAVRLQGRPRHDHLRPRAGILPDRRALLLRAPGPDRRGPHAVRRQAAQGPGTRGPVLRLDSRARARLHARGRGRALRHRRAGQDAAQRSRPEPVRDRADLRTGQRRHRPPDDGHGDAQARRAQARARLPAAREAVCRHQRLRQARQLEHGRQRGQQPPEPRRHAARQHPVPGVLRGGACARSTSTRACSA